MLELKESQKMKFVQLYDSVPKQCFEPYPDPKNSPLRPQKDKNSPKSKSNSKVRIEGRNGNESCSTILVDPKTFFEIKRYN